MPESITAGYPKPIPTGAVNAEAIADGAVETEAIANQAVTEPKLADGEVTNAKLATNSVSSTKILANAVTTSKIADNAVTGDKLAHNLFLEGLPSVATLPRNDEGTGIANAEFVNQNRHKGVQILNYFSSGQPVNTLAVTLFATQGGFATEGVEVGDVLMYWAETADRVFYASIIAILDGNDIRIPAPAFVANNITTNGFGGGNVGATFFGTILPIK
jgi:hypothetical protein